MELAEAAFPALLIADDGWVEYFKSPVGLGMWNQKAVSKYRKRRVLLFDSQDHVWRVIRISPRGEVGIGKKLLAYTLWDPPIPITIDLEAVTEHPFAKVQALLRAAIDADDDVLTQFTEANDLRESSSKAKTFKQLIAILKRKGAI